MILHLSHISLMCFCPKGSSFDMVIKIDNKCLVVVMVAWFEKVKFDSMNGSCPHADRKSIFQYGTKTSPGQQPTNPGAGDITRRVCSLQDGLHGTGMASCVRYLAGSVMWWLFRCCTGSSYAISLLKCFAFLDKPGQGLSSCLLA